MPGVPWQHNPFGAEIEEGFVYGRGAADMKGAVPAMIHAVAGVDRSRLRGRIVVTATATEENLEGVALKAVMDAIPPDFVVIGEATELRLVRGGRGRALPRFTWRRFGRAGPLHAAPGPQRCARHAAGNSGDC